MEQAKQNEKRWDVITVGDVFQDIVMTGFNAWPQPGEEVYAQQLELEVGGGAAITACGLARLGMSAALLALIGQGGDTLVQRITSLGVSDELIHRPGGDYAGISICVSSAQDRAFFTYAGSNLALPELLLYDEATCHKLTTARHVHLAFAPAPELLQKLTQVLHEAGTTVSLDLGWHPEWLTDHAARRALRSLDLFFPNEREARLITGQTEPARMLQVFVKKHFPPVILKLGANGSATLRAGEYLHADPYQVTALDTTGAGDCFDAGFLYGWLYEMSMEHCLRWGNICGALSTQCLGGIAGFPSRKQVEQKMSAN